MTKKKSPEKSTGFNIMVVDDEAEIATTMANNLGALTGHNVTFFSDPVKGLHEFLKNPYHMLITDICMPFVDGYELIRQLRRERPNCQVIVITGHKNLENVVRAQRYGASYIFFKPVDPEELEQAVGTMYKRHLYWQNRLAEF